MNHFGLASIVICWVGLLFLIRMWKGNASLTFSQHAAQTKSAQIYYAVLWAICMPLFWLFMMNEFIPHFKFGTVFTYSVVGAVIAWIVAAAVPETIGWKVTVHRIAAFGLAYFMALIMLLFVLSQQLKPALRLAAGIALAVMIIEIVYLNYHKRNHKLMLPLQALYFAVFHACLLAIWYL